MEGEAGEKTSGRWKAEEHQVFIKALQEFGRDWEAVGRLIPSRSTVQIRSHAQKYFKKLGKFHEDMQSFDQDVSQTFEKLTAVELAQTCAIEQGIEEDIGMTIDDSLSCLNVL
jgi:SHAQKYF class myb-like DNA-binding protein